MTISTTTPKEITYIINKFCTNICADSRPIYLYPITEEWALPLECFDNVKIKIERDGGSIQYGWLIWEWTNVLIEAEFHAIWMSPNGSLTDITPRTNGEDRVLFLPDNNRAYKGTTIDNIRRAVRDVPLIHEYLDLCSCMVKYLIKGELNMNEFRQLNYMQIEKIKMIEQLKSLKVDRNEECPCGSGRKYKKCHGINSDLHNTKL